MSKAKKTITSSIEDKLDNVNKKLDSILTILKDIPTIMLTISNTLSQYADSSNKHLETIAILLSSEAEADKQLATAIKATIGISMPTSALPTKEAKK
jgi:hypothetical protein